MTGPLNRLAGDFDLEDLLDLKKKEAKLEINCHAIATVKSVNTTKQILSASINYSRTVTQKQGDQYVPVAQNYPLLLDLPYISFGGGACALTAPIAVGDQCLVMFNDRDIDNWVAGSSSGSPRSNRLHSMADGIALVGLNKVSSFDAVRMLLSNGTVKVGINPSNNKATIKSGSTTLGAVLTTLVTHLTTFATACSAATTVAQVAAAAGTLSTALGTDSTSIGGLLE